MISSYCEDMIEGLERRRLDELPEYREKTHCVIILGPQESTDGYRLSLHTTRDFQIFYLFKRNTSKTDYIDSGV